MSQMTLDRVLELNRQLAALSEAGVALELGAPSASVQSVLDKANASLALRVSLGQPLAKAVEGNEDLPGVYRHALATGLRSDDLTTVLEGVSCQSSAKDDLRRTLGQSFVQPLVLFALAYAGFILLCLCFSPTLEGIYDQLGQQPNIGVVFMRTARYWLPVWGPLAPLLTLLVVVLWHRGSGAALSWIPLAGRYAATVAQANFADQLASLLEKDVPLSEALELASGVTGNAALVAASATLAGAQRSGERLSPDDQRLRRLPPLLRWGLTGDLGDESLAEVLRFAAHTYRQSAERQAAVWRVALPALIGALVGGAIVLAYALSMFGSLFQMLKDISVYSV
jgi:type II secretory pathway component PulF